MELSKSVGDNMQVLMFGIILVVLGTIAGSDGLITCVCSGSICAGDTCLGEICFSKVLAPVEPGAGEDRSKGCYFNSQAANVCNSTSALHTTLCCHGELCNEELSPTLSPTQPPPGERSPDPYSPSAARGNSDHTLTPPTGSGSPSCYQSDSTLGSIFQTCSLEAFCYSTLRRRSDGSVIHRRGCTDAPCVNETRNRKIKRCCNTSLCNVMIEDPLAPTTPTSPPPTPSTQPSTPLATYRPPTLNPLPQPSEPTDAPPTAPPTNRTLITCYCDRCQEATICTTDVACGTWFHHSLGEGLSVTNFCLSTSSDCGPIPGTADNLECCYEDYCNNFEVGSEQTTMAAATSTAATSTGPGGTRAHTGNTTSLSTVAMTTQTTPTSSMTATNHDIYFLVGIGVFVVAGIILIIIVIVVICYCLLSRRPAPSRKAKKATEASKSSVELAVGTTLSFPSPNIYSSRRESSRESVSTDANSSSLPVSENNIIMSRTTCYSSTSV